MIIFTFTGCLTVAGYAIYAIFFIITRFFADDEEVTDNQRHTLICAQCFGVLMSAFWLGCTIAIGLASK